MSDRAPTDPLPRGPHKLSRSQVEQSQRLRLALATITTMGRSGYQSTSVADILREAGVSRQTFYALYANKLDCFLEALDLIAATLLGQLETSTATASGVPGAADAATRYLDLMAANLDAARLFIVETHAAGSEALDRRAALQTRLADELAGAMDVTSEQDRFACVAFVAAVSALVTVPVTTRDLDALQALRGPLVDLLERLFRR